MIFRGISDAGTGAYVAVHSRKDFHVAFCPFACQHFFLAGGKAQQADSCCSACSSWMLHGRFAVLESKELSRICSVKVSLNKLLLVPADGIAALAVSGIVSI